MDALQLLINLHQHNQRQGPGSTRETQKALELTGLDTSRPLKIADIGCGTGSSALELAQLPEAHVTAVDFSADFIQTLKEHAAERELNHKITALTGNMENLPFEGETFDLIWSEGAIYNIGFEKGIRDWRQYLKPSGILVVSEITWLTGNRPEEIEQFWQQAYPEIATASTKLQQLESCGYSPVAYFSLPEYCWLDNYYTPLEKRLPEFLAQHNNSPETQAIVEEERKEVALYQQYKDYYSYGVYIARKAG